MNEHARMTRGDRSRSWWSNPVFPLVVGLVWAFCFSNLLLGESVSDSYIEYAVELLPVGIALGMLGAQAALHSIWMVFGTWDWKPRFLVSVLVALLLCAAFFAPLLIGDESADAVVGLVNALLCMPLLLFAVQAPLWVMKAGWRFGIVPSHVLSSRVQTRALSIQDLLVATAVIAVAITATNGAVTTGGLSGTPQFLTEMTLAAGAVSAVSLLIVVSALLITLCVPNIVISMLLASVIQTAVYVGLFAVMCAVFNETPDGEEILILVGSVIGFTVSFNTPLLYLRHQGYRLRRADRSERQD